MEDSTKRMNDVYDYLLYKHIIDGQADMAKELKTSRPNITAMLNGRQRVTDDTLRKINDAFPGIFNLTWLLTGELPMFIDDLSVNRKPQTDVPEYVQTLVDTAVKLIKKNETLEIKLERLIAHNEVLSDQLSTLLTMFGANKRIDTQLLAASESEIGKDTARV